MIMEKGIARDKRGKRVCKGKRAEKGGDRDNVCLYIVVCLVLNIWEI